MKSNSVKSKPIAVVITPTYNESENVATLVKLLKTQFAKVPNYQMLQLVVDDTSPDKTYEVVQKLQKTNPQLKLLINREKSGLGGAYLKGMKYAFSELGADVIFEFDADMQHDATKIPVMLKKIDEGFDFVLGSRYIKGGSIPKSWGLWRKFLSVVGNWVIMMVLTNFSVRDWTSGYRAITKKVFDKVGKAMEKKEFQGYTFQVAFLHKTVRAGFRITEVPFHFAERTAGESKLGTEYIKNNLIYLFSARFKEIVGSRVFKFAFVGGVAALAQILIQGLIGLLLGDQAEVRLWSNLILVVGFETGIITNFVLNNKWTFKSHKLEKGEIVPQFIKFNVNGLASFFIQLATLNLGLWISSGWQLWFIKPSLVYTAIGIIIGMFWNYFIYNRFIWRTNK